MNRSRPILFLDRDGTLISEEHYLKDPAKVRLLPGVAVAMRQLAKAGFPLVIVTNQSGVGRGLISVQDVRRVDRRFRELLQNQGIRLGGVYWCPHRPTAGCSCRKPRLGMVRRAARALGMSWRGAISVGDKSSDVALGRRTGGKGVLVLTGHGRITAARKNRSASADYVAANFKAAARWILKAASKRSP